MCALLKPRRVKSASKCEHPIKLSMPPKPLGHVRSRFQRGEWVASKACLGNAFLLQARSIKTGSHTRKLVYMSLCDRADDKTGLSWPSVKTICDDTELSERPVRRILGELERLGFIRVERRGNQHLVSRYWITKQGCSSSTLRVLPEQAKGARHDVKGAPQAPQASVSPIEATKGNGHPPRKFISELNAQIKTATERIERLKESGNPLCGLEIKELCEKRKRWREEMLNQ